MVERSTSLARTHAQRLMTLMSCIVKRTASAASVHHLWTHDW